MLTSVDLVQIVISSRPFSHQSLHLAGQLIVDRERHVLRRVGNKVCHQRRGRLDTVRKRNTIRNEDAESTEPLKCHPQMPLSREHNLEPDLW